MHERIDSFTNARQQKISYYQWTGKEEPSRLVFIAHGYGEHAGRYAHLAERLVDAGCAVVAPDHRGHGKSEGERAHFGTFDEPVEDLRLLYNIAQKTFPNIPVYVFGHSMGSLIALLFTLRYQADVKALVLSGTATNAEDGSTPLMVNVGKLLAGFIPKIRALSSLPASALTKDPDMLAKYDSDPLNDRGKMRLGIASQMVEVGRKLRQEAKALTLPLLVIHGEDDKLTPISGAHAIYNVASSTDKTLKTYPNLRHELINEVERETVLNDIVGWIEAH